MEQFNFPEQISGFSRVEYLSVFVALLCAFAISEFFMGWGKMIRQKDSIVFSKRHLLWSLIFFWGIILNWYILWQRMLFIGKGFIYFILTLLPILLFFFSTIFLFPDFDKERNMKVYLEANEKTIVLLFSGTLLVNVLIGLFMKESSLIAPVNIIRGTISLLGIFSAVFNIKKLLDILIYLFLISIITGTIIISLQGV